MAKRFKKTNWRSTLNKLSRSDAAIADALNKGGVPYKKQSVSNLRKGKNEPSYLVGSAIIQMIEEGLYLE